MSITNIRFKSVGDTLVLQVCEAEDRYNYSMASWRDAQVTDMLDVAPFINGNVLARLEGLEWRLNQKEKP